MKNSLCIVQWLAKASFVAVVMMTWSAPAQAQVQFNFNYVDAGTTGFNDPTALGATRRAALESSADILEAYFSNYAATTIDIDVDGTETVGLAAAGSIYTVFPPTAGFVGRGDVMRKILGEADPDSGAADGTMTFNFSTVDWEYGTDFDTGEYDFVSTAIHELMHTVGFLSGIESDGSDLWTTPVTAAGTWEPFDEFVADSAGALINPTTFITEKPRWDIASVGGTGPVGLRFIGANAVAANGGSDVYLYSPGTWLDGSSGSHLDDDFYTGTAYVMEHAAPPGLGTRTLSAVEIGILKDIGYNSLLVAAVPEPASILVFGSIALCVLLRRRRKL